MEPVGKTAAPVDADTLRFKYDQAFDRWIKRSQDLFVLFGCDFRVTYANPTFCRTFGVAPEVLREAGFDGLGLAPDMAAVWRMLLQKALDERHEHVEELSLPTRNGVRCYRLRIVPELRVDGEVEALWVAGQDITEIRGTESVLGETEARFNAVAANVPGLVFQLSLRKLDRSVEFHYVSEGATALCGIAPERITLAPGEFVELIHPDDREAFFQSMRLSLKTLANWTWEGRLSGGLRGERWVILHATPRRGNTCSTLWDGIMLDVTDSRRNAEKLRQSEEFLRDLCVRVATVREEEKQAIAHEIHDELGQLLTALKLDLSWMRESDGLTPIVRSKVQRMESLTDDILHRVRDIASTLRPKVLDLGLAAAIEWLAQEFTYRTGAACRLVLDGLDLCDGLDGARTTAIFRIVQESLTNVARHAHARRVDISFAACGAGLRLEIRDDGAGFDPEAVQVSGIGLSGIRERAVILGAELRIDSAAKAGTTLEVVIPAASLRPPDTRKAAHPAKRKRAARRLRDGGAAA
ncbi:PAS domain-containing sensor histidine kinase [Aromatoleum toluclasticum]|uniref:PAS domain-containing sensor histidine kinase n=1 Tax=Aromatoleum toluclasticum TaxID=92003 RepID=UPI00035CD4AC